MKKRKTNKPAGSFGKNVKKSLKKLVTCTKNFFVSLYKKFMELPRKIRYVLGVWAVVIILILSFISCANSTKKFYAKYTKFEQDISKRAIEYADDNSIYATQDNKIKLDLEVLKEENYIGGSELIDDTCDGVSVIYYDDQKDEYVVDSYVNCKKYTSKNYWDYK